ncbi:SDR family NAD(P)-dependent oxidoreductase [Mycolicibacterium setense]|jgi:NAD(P)-dependent dehydrogenase (short-subunit alcohol dehydrogenase family)
MSFAGKVAVVTGGSRGLGREMVEAYAARGADVVIASRKQDNCDAVADAVRARYDVRALPIACNISQWGSCDELVETIYTELGRVDVLVNNAGIAPLYPSIDQVSEALFDKIIDVNLKAPFRLSALIGTRMTAGDGGAILNISSMEAARPSADSVPYAAAKAGLNALTKGLAHAVGPRVRVNAIQCGPFLTDMSAAWDPAERDALAGTLALRRCADPHEIVGAAMFLTGEESSYCTGSILCLDGGLG